MKHYFILILLVTISIPVDAGNETISVGFDEADPVAEYITAKLIQQFPELLVIDHDNPDVEVINLKSEPTGMFYNNTSFQPVLDQATDIEELRDLATSYQKSIIDNAELIPLVSLKDLYTDNIDYKLDTKWINNTSFEIEMNNDTMIRDDISTNKIIIHPALSSSAYVSERASLYTGSLTFVHNSAIYGNHATNWSQHTDTTTGERVHTISLNQSLTYSDGNAITSHDYVLTKVFLSANCSLAYQSYFGSNVEFKAINDTVLEIRSNHSLVEDMQYLPKLYPIHQNLNDTLSRKYLNDIVKFNPNHACVDPRMDPVLTNEFIEYATTDFISAGPMKIGVYTNKIGISNRYDIMAVKLFANGTDYLNLQTGQMVVSFTVSNLSVKQMNGTEKFRKYSPGTLDIQLYALNFSRIEIDDRQTIAFRINRDLLSTDQLASQSSIYPKTSIFYENYEQQLIGVDRTNTLSAYPIDVTVTEISRANFRIILLLSVTLVRFRRCKQ